MRLSVIILWSVAFQVQASSDWLNRTVRVDLIVKRNGRSYDSRYDTVELPNELLNEEIATNGQYPWSVFTIAWAELSGGSRGGQICLSTIISTNFLLTNFSCVGRLLSPMATSIETYFDSVGLDWSLIPKNFVRHYWYIEPSSESSPRIVLLRLHETLSLNPNIQPIRLPSSEDFSYEAWSTYLLGIGISSPGTEMIHLQSARGRILNNNLCRSHDVIPEHEICATGVSTRFNSGFAGGAWVVYEYTDAFELIPVAIGIYRSVAIANETLSFVAASRVSHFIDWIETLQQQES